MDAQANAIEGCPRCRGTGRIDQQREDGSTRRLICACVIWTQRQRAAETAITRRLPERMRAMTLDSYRTGGIPANDVALRVARNFVDNWQSARAEGWTLGFQGRYSAGKTHLAVGTAIEIVRRFLPRFEVVSVPDLLRAERSRFSRSDEAGPTALERAAGVDLLVLDDIGAQYLKTRSAGRSEVDWVDEQLYLLLDERFTHSRPTIYTTNLARTELEQVLSGRVFSRISRTEVAPAFEVEPVAGAAGPGNHALAKLTAAPQGGR